MTPGSRLKFSLHWHLFSRTLFLQGSWNAQRMQNLGLLYALLAWLRTQPRDRNLNRHFFRRYFGFFNTNPYLAGFLIGGLVRLETQRAQGEPVSRQMLETYRDSLGRAFASLGDQLFWLGLRPFVVLAACACALVGMVWQIFLVFAVFGLAQVGMRWWSLEVGFSSGMEIPAILGNQNWHRGITFAKRLAMTSCGLVAGIFLEHFWLQGTTTGGAVFGLGVLLGFGLPWLIGKRLPGEVMLALGTFVSLALGFAISLVGS